MRKACIYKIICNITGEQYFGSTFQNLKERIRRHKSEAKDDKKNHSSKQIINRGDWQIKKVMDVFAANKTELRKIEQNFIENNPCINKNRAYRTEEQRKEQNRIKVKKYYNANKIIINKHYNCCCGGKYIEQTKSRHEKTNKHKNYIIELKQKLYSVEQELAEMKSQFLLILEQFGVSLEK